MSKAHISLYSLKINLIIERNNKYIKSKLIEYLGIRYEGKPKIDFKNGDRHSSPAHLKLVKSRSCSFQIDTISAHQVEVVYFR